jgi:hypothetical protein
MFENAKNRTSQRSESLHRLTNYYWLSASFQCITRNKLPISPKKVAEICSAMPILWATQTKAPLPARNQWNASARL